MSALAFFEIGFGEMVVVGIVALLLFGGRLPDVMRTLGSTYRSFRRGFEDLSRQAMRPDLGSPPYRPVPPASTKPATPAARPAVPAPWSAAPAVAPAPAAPVTTPAPEAGVAPTPSTGSPVSPASPAGPARARDDDEVPFV